MIHSTRSDEDGLAVEVCAHGGDVTVQVIRESTGRGESVPALLPLADRLPLAAAILGWPVDQVTRVDPATHVVVNRPSAEAAEFALRRLAGPANTAETRPWDAAASVFRAALGEGGAR